MFELQRNSYLISENFEMLDVKKEGWLFACKKIRIPPPSRVVFLIFERARLRVERDAQELRRTAEQLAAQGPGRFPRVPGDRFY